METPLWSSHAGSWPFAVQLTKRPTKSQAHQETKSLFKDLDHTRTLVGAQPLLAPAADVVRGDRPGDSHADVVLLVRLRHRRHPHGTNARHLEHRALELARI